MPEADVCPVKMKPRQSSTDKAMTDGGEDWLADYHTIELKETSR